MNNKRKIVAGVGLSSICALALAIPVFKDVDVRTLGVSGAGAVSAYVADEDVIDSIVTESTTEESTDSTEAEPNTTFNTIESPATADVDQKLADFYDNAVSSENEPYDKIIMSENYIDTFYKLNEDPEIELYIDDSDLDKLLEQSKIVDINKYDDELKAIAEEYLAQGYFLGDAEFDALNFGSGTGYTEIDEENNLLRERLYINGFSVVDENNGNNTFYYEVLRMTPEEFDDYMNHTQFTGVTEKQSEGSVVKITSSDEFNIIEITYDRDKGICIFKNDFTEAAKNAVG